VRLSACILAFNERAKIDAAIGSVRFADEIVVVDSGSTDGTAERAAELGARVVQVPFEGFGRLRNAALGHLRGEWILSLDADERCTPEARAEIERIVADPASASAWLVPRRNELLGRPIRHGGWYPDYRQPQLFRRGTLRYRDDPVHEGYELLGPGPPARMRAAIEQVPFASLSEMLRKADRYSTLGAERLASRGRRGSIAAAIGHGLWAFVRIYLLKRGFLDGRRGFLIAFANLEGTFWRYAKLWERDLHRAGSGNPGVCETPSGTTKRAE